LRGEDENEGEIEIPFTLILSSKGQGNMCSFLCKQVLVPSIHSKNMSPTEEIQVRDSEKIEIYFETMFS
jgi:hypothetical protein